VAGQPAFVGAERFGYAFAARARARCRGVCFKRGDQCGRVRGVACQSDRHRRNGTGKDMDKGKAE
jgi:hypothetical protein